jgi:hypothetical protein
MMETTQLNFFLKIQISSFCAPMVCLNLKAMEPIERHGPRIVVLIWPHVLGLESLQLV